VSIVGACAYLFGRDARRAAIRNRAFVLDRHDPDRISRSTRRAFAVQVANYVDLIRLHAASTALIAARVAVPDVEHLAAALRSGRGAVLATVHIGDFNVVSHASLVRGWPIAIPVENLRSPVVAALLTRLRRAHGVTIVPIGPRTFQDLRDHLSRGGVVAMAIDHDVQGTGEVHALFGQPARLSTAAAVLAARARAPIVPVACVRTADGFTAELQPPIAPGDRPSPRLLMRALLPRVEAMIRRHVDQWVMFRSVFVDDDVAQVKR